MIYDIQHINWQICSIRPRYKWDQEYTGVIINPVNSSSAIIRETQFVHVHVDDHQSLELWSRGEASHRDQVQVQTTAPATAASICGFYQTTKNR